MAAAAKILTKFTKSFNFKKHTHNSYNNNYIYIRNMSNMPENTVYGGPKPQNPDQRMTLTSLRTKHKKGVPITMVTAYDYPSAVHIDTAGIDIALVGDSAAMVVHGHDTTLPITLDEMLIHCRAVARGAKRPLLVGDLAFGTYESSSQQAVDTAVRVLKEGGMDAIKLEGGAPSRISAAKHIVEAGIAVMGHVGLTPQAISVLGGFRPQGRNVLSAVKVVETALALQEAGCFSVVLECVPAPVAAAATSVLQIPTIGIGAGPFCSGQVLVYHDLLGMMQHPHHAKVTPKFCKQFAQVGEVINKALSEYKLEVENRSFPGTVHSPYKINSAEVDGFLKELQKMGLDKAAEAAAEAAENFKADLSYNHLQQQEKQFQGKQESFSISKSTTPHAQSTTKFKKRKNQIKNVCQVPAEGQSSDLWSWRKYGQRPIKGSPYPRGYYKCSTLKGCLARKQVERNRSDPGMLIITYTGEHSHPVLSQRNSLSGTSRNKTTTSGDEPTSSSPISPATTLSPTPEKI